ncbi:hypothetical protein DWX97_27090 [Bacteroides cellulosilyticus]|uniref:Uncharacterized protein n=2 Tax=Bacteroides cellulosilyticus TaxID=246787 RepID=A0A412HY88_9BACE|nr:hypothetical protein DWX97_27090 [Bacteroides cellulosilyticus]
MQFKITNNRFMGPYIVLLFLILAGLGAWNIGGMLSKNNISKKEPPKPSNLEQKLKNSVQKTQEEVLIQREELQRLRKKLADQKVEKERQKEEEKRRKKEEKQAKNK